MRHVTGLGYQSNMVSVLLLWYSKTILLATERLTPGSAQLQINGDEALKLFTFHRERVTLLRAEVTIVAR